MTNPSPTHDARLIEHARALWQTGDWPGLAKLDETRVGSHPDRARLALLIAAAYQQIGENEAAGRFVRLARDWGCDENLVRRVLVAGLHHALGRIAAAVGREDRALEYFGSAATAAGLGIAPEQAARIRMWRNQDTLGLALTSEAARGAGEVYCLFPEDVELPPHNRGTFSAEAYASYRQASTRTETDVPRNILLESKSLPRTGLHYLEETLASLLEEGQFSFCEWYQERGCCRTMPCTYATRVSPGTASPTRAHLRLTKSHDLALADPVYTPVRNARRVILLRHPLFMLTSYFALYWLSQNVTMLRKHGIMISRLWHHHDKQMLKAAYRIIDEHFIEPDPQDLRNWLERTSRYVLGFLRKWVPTSAQPARPYQYLVFYEDIDSFVVAILHEFLEGTPAETRERVDAFAVRRGRFSPRQDPFSAPSARLSESLRANAALFEDAARRLLAADEAEYLRLRYAAPSH